MTSIAWTRRTSTAWTRRASITRTWLTPTNPYCVLTTRFKFFTKCKRVQGSGDEASGKEVTGPDAGAAQVEHGEVTNRARSSAATIRQELDETI